MKITKSIICSERIKNKKGEIIGSKEVINEFYENGTKIECVTRGIVRLVDGRVLINKVIQRIVKQKEDYISLNLITGIQE